MPAKKPPKRGVQQMVCQTEAKFWHEICSRKKIQNFSRLPLDKSDEVCIMVEMKERKLGERKMIENTFTIETVYTTDCCGEYCSNDSQICTRCGEHCEVIEENVEVAS